MFKKEEDRRLTDFNEFMKLKKKKESALPQHFFGEEEESLLVEHLREDPLLKWPEVSPVKNNTTQSFLNKMDGASFFELRKNSHQSNNYCK